MKKESLVGNRQSSNKSKGEPKIICSRCEELRHTQSRCARKKVCSTCGGRDHFAERCGTNSRALVMSDSKCFREEGGGPDLAGMMTDERTPCRVMKVGRGSSTGMSQSDSRVDR